MQHPSQLESSRPLLCPSFVFVLDLSSPTGPNEEPSMADLGELTALKNSVLAAVESAPRGARIGLIVFGDRVRVVELGLAVRERQEKERARHAATRKQQEAYVQKQREAAEAKNLRLERLFKTPAGLVLGGQIDEEVRAVVSGEVRLEGASGFPTRENEAWREEGERLQREREQRAAPAAAAAKGEGGVAGVGGEREGGVAGAGGEAAVGGEAGEQELEGESAGNNGAGRKGGGQPEGENAGNKAAARKGGPETAVSTAENNNDDLLGLDSAGLFDLDSYLKKEPDLPKLSKFYSLRGDREYSANRVERLLFDGATSSSPKDRFLPKTADCVEYLRRVVLPDLRFFDAPVPGGAHAIAKKRASHGRTSARSSDKSGPASTDLLHTLPDEVYLQPPPIFSTPFPTRRV